LHNAQQKQHDFTVAHRLLLELAFNFQFGNPFRHALDLAILARIPSTLPHGFVNPRFHWPL
jgi:hypothetical protein